TDNRKRDWTRGGRGLILKRHGADSESCVITDKDMLHAHFQLRRTALIHRKTPLFAQNHWKTPVESAVAPLVHLRRENGPPLKLGSRYGPLQQLPFLVLRQMPKNEILGRHEEAELFVTLLKALLHEFARKRGHSCLLTRHER
ncbi:MAG: hypothetical protein K2R98_05745, partial [Gemmataceae bacterium]|nr:hypothetical protein [Gemmataceae bacterium]